MIEAVEEDKDKRYCSGLIILLYKITYDEHTVKNGAKTVEIIDFY